MMKRFNEQIGEVRSLLNALSLKVEGAIDGALASLEKGLSKDAEKVIKGDDEIDRLTNELEKKCFSILLLDSPYASDFLQVSSALKMATDLERIGDYAVDIAEEITALKTPYVHLDEDLRLLATYVRDLVHQAVYCFINSDLEKARGLDKDDDKIDALFLKVREDAIKDIKAGENPELALVSSLIAKYLERMADHAVNLGEWVDYSVTGAGYLK